MSKFTDELRKVGVYNGFDFANGKVHISYIPQELGRLSRCARWRVYLSGQHTNKNAHWMDHGNKTFAVTPHGGRKHSEEKLIQLNEAKKWASEKYSVKEWAMTPYGDWMEAEFVEKRIAELKAKLNALSKE